MALKQCQSRFGVCRFNHVKTRIDPASGQNRVYEPSRRTTFSSSAGLCCVFTASLSSLEQPLLRLSPPLGWRGVFALRQTSLREINTSTKTLQYDLKPDVPKAEGRMLFFDTHAVVRLLEDNGFSTEQAEVIVKVLVRTTSTNMDIIYSDMVTKVQQEIILQQVMSKIAAVKKDMVILEKSEFSTLLGENEKLKNQLFQLKIQLADVMNKVRSDNLLDMNVEKSLVKELKAEHDKKLLETRTEIMEMTAEQDRHLTQTNMKIDTEVAGLKTMLESHKLDTIKYLAGSVFTCLTVVLGFYRVWM